jgi:23S rRNA pseudouridine1911/1915/1917 synthase
MTGADETSGGLNHGWTYEEQLDGAARGSTALGYLSRRYPRSSEQTWRERIASGEVTLDGREVGPDEPLRPGQSLCWRRPPWHEPDVPLHFDKIFEDEDLLAVCKPSGLPTAPAGGEFLEHTLVSLVRRLDPEWAPMHRLGRGTSGLVVFARTPEARSRLQEDWRSHRVQKLYLALASGGLPAEPFEITAPIGRVAHPLLGSVHAAVPAGRPARSRVRSLGRRQGGSLAEVAIETGRPHQIRIHLAFAGHPLVGDPLYLVGGIPRPDAVPGDLGYLLHAWRLKLTRPRTGRLLELEAEPPAALR